MPIQLTDSRGYDAAIEQKSGALRTTLRGVDVGVLGSYRKAMRSGTMAAGAATYLAFGCRWAPTPNSYLALLRRVVVSMGNTATAFTAGLVSVDAFMARSYSVLENSGGTAGSFGTNNAKLRTDYAPSSGMACYMAATGAISGGTSTLDTDPFGTAAISVPAVAGQVILPPTEIYRCGPGENPTELETNEGFVIKVTVPATGTWQLGVQFDWDEVDPTKWQN